MIQLPNDVVLVGYVEVKPFKYEQVYRSEKCNFTGTEEDFVKANFGYKFVQIDKHTRVVLK